MTDAAVRDLMQLVGVLIVIALLAAGGVAVMRCLRPAQRVVALVGLIAVGVQVLYPPCLRTTLVNSTPVPVGRRMLDGELSYHTSSNGTWIDADRQFAYLVVTVLATTAGCGLIAYFSGRRPAEVPMPPA